MCFEHRGVEMSDFWESVTSTPRMYNVGVSTWLSLLYYAHRWNAMCHMRCVYVRMSLFRNVYTSFTRYKLHKPVLEHATVKKNSCIEFIRDVYIHLGVAFKLR